MTTEAIKIGKYRHYKDKFYQVIGMARHTETLEELVVYKDENEQLWVRPKKMFLEHVHHNGHEIPRFKFIEP
jgi:hypothetical protein